jgi:hypothetical protein
MQSSRAGKPGDQDAGIVKSFLHIKFEYENSEGVATVLMRLARQRMNLALPFLFFFCAANFSVLSQTRMLDSFDSLGGWKSIPSEGVELVLASEEGKSGKALSMHFDMKGHAGYAIAQKDFQLDLPENYQFTFDMRADAPVNNFEFKIIDDHENVWWIKRLNITYPREWTKQRIKRRHLTYAWGPERNTPLTKVRKIEFVVSVGTGGSGRISIDNLRFEAIDDREVATARAKVSVSAALPRSAPSVDQAGTLIQGWKAPALKPQALTVGFGCLKEIGGLVIDWDSLDYAVSYDVLLSEDGLDWNKAGGVTAGNGRRDYIPLPECEGRFLKIVLNKSSRGRIFNLRRATLRAPEFAATPNDLFRSVAADARRGQYAKYLSNEQSYWTVVGMNGDTKEALVNEQGQVEVDKNRFSLEPFLFIDGKLITWNDVTTTPTLLEGYLPFPSVTWNYKNQWELTIEPSAVGQAESPSLLVRYGLRCLGSGGKARLYIALRPFQVNPPWQFLNILGGVAPIDSIALKNGVVYVDDKAVLPMTPPTAFGATTFETGEIVEYLSSNKIPTQQSVHDPLGYASAVLAYDISIDTVKTRDIYVAVPFHAWRGRLRPNMESAMDVIYYRLEHDLAVNDWKRRLATVQIQVPEQIKPVVNTFLSNLAYIFINRDGPGIQPGSRSYERSWIRDGALTCTALLQTGHAPEVREFLDWYAKGQFPSGKIPCVIDSHGPDAVPEHDSNGEFIYAILQYFTYTHDTLWLQGKYDAVVKTVRYMQTLRKQRLTEPYLNGTPEQRALYGIIPESISHEGYSDHPRHSYWDDFFTLRGLKDAVTIASVLGRSADALEFASERDDFRKDFYASMRLAMKNKSIDYIPGCAELGDFDATSTTIGVVPCGELGNIPEPQLHNTFDRYFSYFQARKAKPVNPNYTPYETRVIGTFVYLGQRKRAEEALDYFMNDRRPPAWNHWAEVVWHDPATPKYIGDMPHTWVGSDFIRSVRAMFVYERERDTSLVVGAGIPLSWIADPAGVQIGGFPTYYGLLSYAMKQMDKAIEISIAGGIEIPPGGVRVSLPIDASPQRVISNDNQAEIGAANELILRTLPATVWLEY